MISLSPVCWLCGHDIDVIQQSEILGLPDLIRCSSCNANQGAVKALNQSKK